MFVLKETPIGIQDTSYDNFPITNTPHADVKHSATAGTRSSMSGAEEYAQQAIQRRDELLAKYANAKE
jgi:hypothetical protein